MAIVVIALSVWGYLFLRGRNILKTSNIYYVRYENISSLAPTSAIFIRGMNVGTVADVELEEDMQSIVATLNIKGGIRIPKNTVAVIVSTGLMGGKAIDLKIEKACTGDDCAEPGDFLEGRVKGMFDSILDPGEDGTVSKLKETIGDILDSVGDSLTSPNSDNEIAKTYQDLSALIENLASITGTLDASMGTYDRHLKTSLSNVATLTNALASNQDKIAGTITHLESVMRQLDEAHIGANTGELVTEAKTSMQNLNKTLEEANVSFEKMSALLNDLQAGKGSLGKLMKDPVLYDYLAKTTRDLDLLLQDFRLNPKRYVNVSVFGKKQKEYEVPENDPANQ